MNKRFEYIFIIEDGEFKTCSSKKTIHQSDGFKTYENKNVLAEELMAEIRSMKIPAISYMFKEPKFTEL